MEKQIEQLSEEWFKQRLGKFTASCFDTFLGNGRTKGSVFTVVAQTLIREKLAEILTGDSKRFTNEACEWGTNHEAEAIELYQKTKHTEVQSAPFVPLRGYEDWAGGSPDGFIVEERGIIEVKCPFNSANHIETLLTKSIPAMNYKKYHTQMQFNMLCTGMQFCDFISFDPRMVDPKHKIFVRRFYRDDEHIAKIIVRLDLAIEELKKKLDEIN